MEDADHLDGFFMNLIVEAIRKSPQHCAANVFQNRLMTPWSCFQSLNNLIDAFHEAFSQSSTLLLIPETRCANVGFGRRSDTYRKVHGSLSSSHLTSSHVCNSSAGL